MRIAHIMLGRGFGGAERSFVDIVHALLARGHEVLAIADPRGVALAKLDDAQGPLIIAPVTCHGSWDHWSRWRIRRTLAGFRADVVHTHLARAALHGGAAASALGIPALAKTHNLVKLKYYRDITCLVPTTVAQEHYLRSHGVAPERLERIPNFTRVSAAAPAPANARQRAPGAPYILRALGRFVAKKGFDTLLEALARLAEQGVDVRLQLAGDGPERARLEQLVQTLGLREQVLFPGWTDDVAGFLAGADLLVVPSRDEPFGIVLIEAMACGVPVIATRTQGPLEILAPGTGYFVDADDAAALAATIARALNDEHRDRVAHAAQARFREHYSEDSVVSRYLGLYHRLINAAAR